MVGGFDPGAARTLLIALRVDDGGALRTLTQIQSRAGLVRVAAGDAARNIGLLRAQMAFLAFTGAAVATTLVRQAAVIQKQNVLGSLAIDGTTRSTAELRKESIRLAAQFQTLPSEMAVLLRQVQQFGVHSKQSATNLAEAGAQLSLFTGGDLAADAAASTVFRLLQVTTKSREEFDAAARSARDYATAIAIAGDESAAGIADMATFLEHFATAAVGLRFTRAEIIALSAALTDIQPGRREAFRTAVQRMFGAEFSDPAAAQAFSNLLGVSTSEFQRMRVEEPARLLRDFAAAAEAATGESADLNTVLRALGFTNVRDQDLIKTLVASMEKYDDVLARINDETGLAVEGQSRLAAVLGTTDSQIRGIMGSVQKTAEAFGRHLAPAVAAVALSLEAIASLISGNPALAGLLIAGAGGLTVSALVAGFRILRATKMASMMGGTFGEGMAAISKRLGLMGVLGQTREQVRLASVVGGGGRTFHAAMLASNIVSGILPAILGKGMGGALASRLAPLAARFGAALLGPLGAILALAMGAPMFRSLADSLDRLGDRGGALGFVFRSLANIMRALAVAGNAVGLAFDIMLLPLRLLLRLTGAFLRAIGAGAAVDAALGFSKNLLTNTDAGITRAREALRLERSPSSVFQSETNVNVYAADPQTAARETRKAVARSTTSGTAFTIRTRRAPTG